VLEIIGLTKRFGSVTVLDDVSFRLARGEVHALVGENGAGKSTLVKILTGVYGASGGRVTLDGRPYAPRDPHDAKVAGINAIHQERQLAPRLSGLENLFMGLPYPRRAGLLVDWAAMRRRAGRLLADLDIVVPLGRLAGDMSPAEQTMLEVARACLLDNRILVLDEPTASLTDHEAGRLFALMARLKAGGASFIYVSHRLEEILAISDQVTVLRNGRLAARIATADATKEGLVASITGRDFAGATGVTGAAGIARVDARALPPLLEVRDLAMRDGRVASASFALHPGEVLGLFGLAGAGRTELVEAIYGVRPLKGGEIRIRGERLARPSPRRSARARVAMLSEDRRANGLVARRSVRDNMTLQTIDRYSRLGFVRRGAEGRVVRGQIDRFAIRAHGPHQLVDTLSGGNQQKVLLARMLLADPAILLCDEPTHAVDVGARALIHTLLIEKARQGCGVLFVSSDLTELAEVADRLVIMGAGRTVAEVMRGELGATEIMRLCYEAYEANGTGGGHARAG